MPEPPKANAVQKNAKESWGIARETSLDKWWEDLAPQNGFAPKDKREITKFAEIGWNLGGTSVKPWWNLDWWNLPRNFFRTFWQPKTIQNGRAPENQRDNETCATLVEPSAEPFGSPRRSAPEDQRDNATLVKPWWNLGETLVKACCNLPQNLLAAQDGFAPEDQRHHETGASLVEHGRPAPENRRESESDSAPKPLLWLKTPKLLLLGKNYLNSRAIQGLVL